MVQRKVKRRVVLIAVGAAVFAGYSAITLFANDNRSAHVDNLNKVPAAKSLGIRLQSAAGKSNEAASVPNSNLEQLSPPPRMSDVGASAVSGKVTVRLTSEKSEALAGSAKDLPTFPKPTLETAQQPSLAIPGALPKQTLSPESTKVDSAVVRIALGDSVFNNGVFNDNLVADLERFSSSENTNNAALLPVPRPRNPELIKPKSFQISESVTLASAPEIEMSIDDQSMKSEKGEMSDAMVVLVPPPLETGSASSKSTNRSEPSSASDSEPTLSIISLASPTSEIATTQEESGITGIVEDKPSPKMGPNFDLRWAKTSPIATVEMESQSATAFEIPGLIHAVAVENEDVCRVLHTERTISIVGNKQGSSLVQIWTSEIKDVPQLLRVNVSQPWQKPNATPADLNDVKQALTQAFPKSILKLTKQDDGTLEVRGTTENEETARRVLEMVRKLCLVPVKDKVIVSR